MGSWIMLTESQLNFQLVFLPRFFSNCQILVPCTNPRHLQADNRHNGRKNGATIGRIQKKTVHEFLPCEKSNESFKKIISVISLLQNVIRHTCVCVCVCVCACVCLCVCVCVQPAVYFKCILTSACGIKFC